MLKLLNKLLRELLVNSQIGLATNQIWFEVPVPNWNTSLVSNQIALNIYLVDLRENRKLRTSERVRLPANGIMEELPAPARMDCHYLISAWDPAQASTEPTLDEHALLYKIAAILINHGPVNPSKVYATNPPLPSPDHWPDEFWKTELPIQVVPAEGFPKLSEFWTSMGQGSRWKPVVYLIVTVPVALTKEIAGPMVTTLSTEYLQTDKPETAEVWIQIGGTVSDKAGNPVAAAWVRLEAITNEPLQTTETDELGHFTFVDLQPGQYQLNWRAQGFPIPAQAPRVIDVPSPTGEYDLKLP